MEGFSRAIELPASTMGWQRVRCTSCSSRNGGKLMECGTCEVGYRNDRNSFNDMV